MYIEDTLEHKPIRLQLRPVGLVRRFAVLPKVALLACAGLIFGPHEGRADAGADIAAHVLAQGIGSAIAAGIPGFSDIQIERSVWRYEEDQLRAEIRACGDCPQRRELEDELAERQERREALDAVIYEVLEAFSFGDTAWRDGWLTLFGIREPGLRPGQRSTAEVLSQMRAAGVPKQCQDYYVEWRECIARHGGDAGYLSSPCYDVFQLQRLCEAGDREGLGLAEGVRAQRAAGHAIPGVSRGPGSLDFNFGGVPDDFHPQLPPRDLAQAWLDEPVGSNDLPRGRQVFVMRKESPSTLTRITIGKASISQWFQGNLWSQFVPLPAASIIECLYRHADPRFGDLAHYWYESVPDVAVRFMERDPSHPLRRVRAARSDCPLRFEG